MKREFLEGFKIEGLTKEVIDQIMAEHGKSVQAEQAKTTAKDGELVKANETIKGLQETVKKFDGVDVDKLKQSAADWETKYNTDVAAERAKAENLKKEYDLKDALKAQGVLDPDYLIFKHGGIEKFAFADGKPVGLEDITKPYKESSPHLFAQQENKLPIKTGLSHQGGGEGVPDKKEEANAAFRSLFGKGE